ncbi:hypothetical protein GC170_09210 [bacterium]|nr:hypothetical protein [bacterium]
MHEIRIPRLGWSMEEGTFVRWLKNEGDIVARGDAIFELEGDKNVQEIEAVEAGSLHIPPNAPAAGTRVEVGTLLGYLLAAGEHPPESSSAKEQSKAEEPPYIAAGPAARRMAAELGIELGSITGSGRSGLITKDDVSAAAENRIGENAIATSSIGKIVATPRARRAASDLGVDWRSLKGSGRNGRIREADILAASQAHGTSHQAAAKPLGQKLSPRRRAIADRLRRSQEMTVPVTLHTTVDVTEFVALRERLKAATPQLPPAYTDIIGALLPRVFKAHPAMAWIWDDTHQGLNQVTPDEIHIGIAVDTPEGLLVPVIKSISSKTLPEITAESRHLIEMARTGKLPGDAMRSGTFTITNLGSFGIDGFTPVINYPEIAILGLGAIRREPVFMKDDRVVARLRMTLSLTFDHAAVDGAPAAAFLRDIGQAVSDPAAFCLNFG